MDGSFIRVRSIDCPRNTLPESGSVLPVMTSIIVVLPAPFGPMMQRNSPASIDSVSAFNARKPSKLTVTSSRYRIVPCETSISPGTTACPMLATPLNEVFGGFFR